MSGAVLLRSTVFALFQILTTPLFAAIALLTFPFDTLTRYRIISVWARWNIAAVRMICGIRYRVLGAGHIPREPCVILAKHQSAWETLAFQCIFPPQVWVVKRELLWVPFFGWGSRCCRRSLSTAPRARAHCGKRWNKAGTACGKDSRS